MQHTGTPTRHPFARGTVEQSGRATHKRTAEWQIARWRPADEIVYFRPQTLSLLCATQVHCALHPTEVRHSYGPYTSCAVDRPDLGQKRTKWSSPSGVCPAFTTIHRLQGPLCLGQGGGAMRAYLPCDSGSNPHSLSPEARGPYVGIYKLTALDDLRVALRVPHGACVSYKE